MSDNKLNKDVRNSILIGIGLETDKPHHLLVDSNGIKFDKIMTQEEYALVKDVLIAVRYLPK